MNTIKIYLAESGRIADLSKDFPLFKGQFNDKLLNVYVPTSILAPQFNIQHYIGQMSLAEIPSGSTELNTLLNAFVVSSTPTGRNAMTGDVIEIFDSTANKYYLYTYGGSSWTGTEVDSFGTFTTLAGTSVKLGLITTKRNGTMYESKSYFMRYLKTLTYEGKEYALYERKLPKEFTSFVGTSTIIANVVNVDTQSNQITSLITSQSCELEVFQSTMLDQDEPIEASDMETLQASLQSIDEQLPLKQDKNDESISTNSVVTTQNVVGAINDISSQTSINTANIGTNSEDIADIKTEQIQQNSRLTTNEGNISTNANNISDLTSRVSSLEQQSGVEETYIGQMQGENLPTATQLNAFVFSEAHRTQQGGDVIIFVQTIPNATDKVFKYTYSAVTSQWSNYEIPATEAANNTTKGIVQGSYSAGTDLPTQVDIIGGNIRGIYVVDNSNNKREIAEYLNTNDTTLATTTSKANTNEQNIALNTAAIAENAGTLTNILNGTTAVGKAQSAAKDGLNRNIAQTYMTQNAGATKQQLYNYALPRTFNDVSFLNAENVYSSNLPIDPSPIYSASSTSIGYTDLFYANKIISNAEFDLSSNNSYSTTLWVSASADCNVTFRLTTQIYNNGEWVTLNTELSEQVTMSENVVQKIMFASSFNSLEDVLNVVDGNIIKQTCEVLTETSAPLVFSVYSNTTYPSTFNLNSTSQTIVVKQGKLGELPVLELSASVSSNQLTFVLPETLILEDKVEALFILSTLDSPDNTVSIQLLKNAQIIPIYAPENLGTNATITVGEMITKFAANINKWVFTGTFRIVNDDIYVLADVDDISTSLADFYTKAETNTLLEGKQNSLTVSQLNAVNSGITSSNVSQIAANTNSIHTNATNIGTNTTDINTLKTQVTSLQSSVATNTSNITNNSTSITALQQTTASIQAQTTTNTNSISALGTRVSATESDIDTIEGKIPVQASSSNQLADKAFVNSTIQTASANFRGNWATWSAVPTSASSYPEDVNGNRTPTTNDYMVVQDASGYTGQTLSGTWRFKYVGVWATNGIAGWQPEYQVNETPLTQAQLDALNSGIDSTKVTQIATNTSNISSNTTAIGTNTNAISGLTTRMGTAEGNISTLQGTQSTQGSAITQNANNISNLTSRVGANETAITAIPNNYVSYTTTQTLSDAQKLQARTNIGAGDSGFSGYYTDLLNKPVLKTDNTTAQSTSASETIDGTINLHKVAKTGTASDLIGYSDLAQASTVTNLASTVGDNTSAINTINGKIPSAATTTNQLADKDFVNSSIATNTATFRGTYNLVSDLSLTTSATQSQVATALASAISTADANDYCFVLIPTADATPTQIASVERYKYSSGWAYEYTLNNSGFTAEQWAAINSGANTTNIGSIANKVDKNNTRARVYGTDIDGNQSMIQYSNISGANALVMRTNDGHIHINYTINSDYDAVNKKYVDDADALKQDALTETQLDAVNSGIDSTKVGQIANKVDKTTSSNQVYATDGSGNQTTYTLGTSSGNIPKYDSNARLQSATPSANTDVANKSYVDSSVTAITPTSWTDATVNSTYATGRCAYCRIGKLVIVDAELVFKTVTQPNDAQLITGLPIMKGPHDGLLINVCTWGEGGSGNKVIRCLLPQNQTALINFWSQTNTTTSDHANFNFIYTTE